MRKLTAIAILISLSLIIVGCGRKNSHEKKLTDFIDRHLQLVQPLVKQLNLAYWDAATSGSEEDYNKVSVLELELREIYSSTDDFNFLKQIKQSGQIKDRLLARQLNDLYNSYLENQIDPVLMKQIVELGTKIEQNFSTHRAVIDGNEVTDNQIREILKQENDSEKRKIAWLASKQVGPVVADDLIRLVKLRNQAARQVGFDNYHTMRLALGEQDVNEIDKIFAELHELTEEPFLVMKVELDEILAEKYGVDPFEIMPWHYHDPFFQDSPLVYELDLDSYYQDKDVKQLAADFYESINLPIDSILAKSDLYERPGKNPHAFCTDIDRAGDVRILANLRNNEQWMETILHESGHAVYDKYQNLKTPWLIRGPAHTFTTEAIAMLFGRLSRNAAWMKDVLGLTEQQKDEIAQLSAKYAQMKQLIFARWAMVMYNFEKELYANPDQDLNTLWWDMVGEYQFVAAPLDRDQPNWAAKIHFTIAPCYYHNYALGELLASQLHNKIVADILEDPDKSYVGRKQIGSFLKQKVFEPGATYHWNDMIEKATGEKLTAKYFVEQFVADASMEETE